MCRKKFRYGLILFLFVFQLFTVFSLNDQGLTENYNSEPPNRIKDEDTNISPRKSANSNPLYITGNNWTDAASQWWCSGSGTKSDPYIIEDLEIDGQDLYSGIIIENSTAYFAIKNISISNIGSLDSESAGIKLINTSNGIIQNSSFSSNYEGNYGIFLTNNSNSQIIKNNTLSFLKYGIYILYDCLGTIIQNNFIYNMSYAGIYSYSDSSHESNDFTKVRNNIITNCSNYAVYLRYNYYSEIVENLVYKNQGDGIQLSEASHTQIRDNLIMNSSQQGLELYSCVNISIINNDIVYNSFSGLILDNDCDRGIVERNNCSFNSFNGISVIGASNNNMTKNIVLNNSNYGIQLMHGGSTPAMNNIIIKNYVSGSGIVNAYEQDLLTNNAWNNSIVGNYWGDYAGIDGDGDGLGDTIYNITVKDSAADNKPIVGDPRWNGSAISIDGDGSDGMTWEYARTRFWCDGSGSQDDPYIIEDLVINAQNKSAGIEVQTSSAYFIIQNCTVYNSSAVTMGGDYYGLRLYWAHYGSIIDCIFHSNGLYGPNEANGVNIYGSDYITFRGNHIYNNTGIAVNVQSCEYLTFENNIIEKNSQRGTYFLGNLNGSVSGNIFRNNGETINDHGLDLRSTESINFTYNEFSNNGGYGLNLWTGNHYNRFFLNNFSSNGRSYPVYEESTSTGNYWNNSEIGNYWYGYNAPDDDDDGIGDIPYDVYNGPGIDYLPIRDDGFNGTAIHINNTASNGWEWAKTRVWCSGTGTEEDPYIIEDIAIDANYESTGILIESSNKSFQIRNVNISNSQSGSEYGAIKLSHVSNGILKNNQLENNLGAGIRIEYAENISITDNYIFNASFYGIHIGNLCNNFTINENYILNATTYGFYFYTSSNMSAFDNIIEGTKGSGYAIAISQQSDYSVIRNNSIFSGKYGISLSESDLCQILNNSIYNNSNTGIIAVGTNNTLIYQNLIENNTNFGIYILADGNNSIIYSNQFISNGENAKDNGIDNQWNNNSSGNYWDDYEGFDVDGDGIGETVYNISGDSNSIDNHPIWSIRDTFEPIISIINPISDTLYGKKVPSFNITINEYILNETWYTLDFGAKNITIDQTNGFFDTTEWQNLPNGTVTIQFYANDTSGNIGMVELEVRKDSLSPIIFIDKPSDNSFFDTESPEFNLTFMEPHLNRTWYTLNDGSTNTTFLGNGSIISGIWSPLIDNTYTLIFYANDSVGNLGSNSLQITKDTTNPIITIDTPTSGNEFDKTPIYDISITETNIERIWYTILVDGDWTHNTTISTTSGGIDGDVWDSLDIGTYTMRFYVEDKVGRVNHDEITITKVKSDSSSSSSDTSDEPNPLEPYVIYIIIGAISSAGVAAGILVRKSKKELKKTQKEVDKLKASREEVTEEDITISKEKHICLVHKGPIEGYSFICPNCGAYYCANCVEAIKEAENECWSCGKSLDQSKSKPDKFLVKKEDTPSITEEPEDFNTDGQKSQLDFKKISKEKANLSEKTVDSDQKMENQKKELTIKAPKKNEIISLENKIKEFEGHISKMEEMRETLEQKFQREEISQEEYIEKRTILAEKMGEAQAKLENLKEKKD